MMSYECQLLADRQRSAKLTIFSHLAAQPARIRFDLISTLVNRLSSISEGGARRTMDGVIVRRRENTMKDCLRPLLASMRLFGLYFERQPEGSGDEKSCKCNPWMIYSIFVVSVLWLNVVRMFSVFTSDDAFGMILLHKILAIIWMFQSAVSQTSFYASCHLGTLDAFMKMKLSDRCASYIRRMAIIYAISTWSVIAICSSFILYGLFFTGGFMDFMMTPIASHATVNSNLLPIPRTFTYILSFYLMAAHTFPQAMTYLLAKLFSYRFKRVNEELNRCLESQHGQVGDADIEVIRKQHQEISMSVRQIDDCLMFSNASAFCCQLCCFIILLYTLVFYHSHLHDPVMIAVNVFWMALMTAGLAFTTAGGIRINHHVSRIVLRWQLGAHATSQESYRRHSRQWRNSRHFNTATNTGWSTYTLTVVVQFPTYCQLWSHVTQTRTKIKNPAPTGFMYCAQI